MIPESLRGACARWLLDMRGAMSPLFAVVLVPMIGAVGLGVDYTSSVRVKTELQAATDLAVLAAAKLNDTDAKRETIARRYFEAQLRAEVLAMVQTSEFKLSPDLKSMTGTVRAAVPTTLAHMVGSLSMGVGVKSVAAIAKPSVRQLDMVMCIDATGSMSATLNAVKTNALNFESNLNTELTKRGADKFDLIRVRVIYYRDYGGTSLSGGNTYVSVYTNGSYVTKLIKSTDPDYWTYVGDNPALKSSGFFELPAKRTDLQNYVNPETAWGGGDLPESGLECVNEAMDSAWGKVGDVPASVGKAIEMVYPVIAVWTDAAAHKPSYSVSLKNPGYPVSTKMPRTYVNLRAKWDNQAIVPQTNKLLVFFGNPDLNSNDADGKADGWQNVKLWPAFMLGGTLTEGNSNMVSKLADAIVKVVKSPTLTQ